MGRLRQRQRKVPYSRLEIHWPYLTASPKPQILSHTHSFTLMSAVMGVLTLALFPQVTSNVISRIWRLLIFILCKNRIHPCHSSWQPLLGSSLCQCCAEHLSLMDLTCFGLMRALFRGWILSTGWHGRLRIRRLWFPSRLQGWICARASMFI